jgi:hypothetical protein
MGTSTSVLISRDTGTNIKSSMSLCDILNGDIHIKTSNIKTVFINGEKCVACSKIKLDAENDEAVQKIYNKYCT